MPNVTKQTADLRAAPPPSLTESQRRFLADTLRLGDDTPRWDLPTVFPDSAKLRTVKAELERGLQPTRPQFLKWCCDKLSSLPTQTATGMNSALWTDNVIDVCAEFPEDILQTVTLELLKSCTFRPSPAEVFKAADAKHGLRKRMLERTNLMLRGGQPAPDAPAEKPIETRLGRMEHTRTIYVRMKRMTDVARIDREIAVEKGEPVPAPVIADKPIDERPPFVPSTSPSAMRTAQLAAKWRGEKPVAAASAVPQVAPASDDWDTHEVV